MRFKFRLARQWPALAWLATIDSGSNVVTVTHGQRVETCDDWFCEAVWAGEFNAGDFDRTDQIFGSGARLRNGKLTFVSSGTTVDRLQWIKTHDGIHVSNSLVCLMKHVNATLDPTFARYQQFFGTILSGIHEYDRELMTSAGKVRLCYFHNLALNGDSLDEVEKPETASGFGCFQDYRDYLAVAMKALAKNLQSPDRTHAFKFLGTISSGYDSPAITTLACEAGLKEVISFTHSKTGKKDTGEVAAKVLGVNLTLVDREAWKKFDLPEAAFVSSDAKGEDCYFRGAQDLIGGCGVLTGFQAGQAWQKKPVIIGRGIQRKDRSGTSLTEYRLRAGFFQMAVGYMGLRHIDDMARIAQSPEMAPWDLHNDYNKPIPRRIVETAGVPREAFGMEKKAASVVFNTARNMLSPSTQADFAKWLSDHAADFWRNGKVPPDLRDTVLAPFQWCARRAWSIYGRTKTAHKSLHFVRDTSRAVAEWGEKERLSWYLFPWAIERAKSAYASEIHDEHTTPTHLRTDEANTRVQHAISV
jgi:hypothetical protein